MQVSILVHELRNVEEPPEPPNSMPRSPILLFPRSPCYGEMFSTEKEDISTLKASPMRVNIFKGLSALRAKKAGGQEDEGSDGRSSDRSEGVDYNYPLDSDSDDVLDGGESEEANRVWVSGVRKSFSYGTLAYANHAGASTHSNTSSSEDEDWIYYSHYQTKGSSLPHHPMQDNPKRRLLPWRKRKLSFKSPKMKGEPLLKKGYGEEGGDDIDFDRRQLSSSDESTLRVCIIYLFQSSIGRDSVHAEQTYTYLCRKMGRTLQQSRKASLHLETTALPLVPGSSVR